MPQIDIAIGGRTFEVACQEGEEHYLHSAAAMLDAEATHLSSQIGRMPEARMLLMSGLMLADKTAGLEDKVKESEAAIAQLQAQIDTLESRPATRVEVPVVSTEVTDTLAEIAARAESLADQIDGGAA
ncbi:MAG: cell division protein ZapA [Yoonia sp.]